MSSENSTNRREFITGHSAGQLAANAAQIAADHVVRFADSLAPQADSKTESRPAGYVLKLNRRAMACDFEVRMNADRTDDNSQTAAAVRALNLVDELETQMTVYRDQSELIEINQQAATDWVPVEDRLFTILELAGELHRETEGVLDITAGPLSRIWGFDHRKGRLPKQDEIDRAKSVVGWQYVELDRASQRVRFRQSGVELNLNSIGKGYAADRAAELLMEEGVRDFLIHGGRSTLLARGRRTGEQGWTARVRHPLRPQQVVAEFTLVDQALSTSGSATQSFVLGGKRYGHLIDPRTGWPADTMHSATVVAPNGVLADALSTAFYVMGEEATAEYCERNPNIRALLVMSSKQQGEVRLSTFNLTQIDP